MTLQDPTYYPHSINNSFTYQDMRGGIMKMNAVKPGQKQSIVILLFSKNTYKNNATTL